jgi:hypothetical protein
MDQTAILAIIAGIQLMLFTALQWWLTQRTKRDEYRRQDEVAARVALVAVTANESQKTLNVLVSTTEKVHKLVNSDMTTARTNERTALQLLLLSLRRMQALPTQPGAPSETDTQSAIRVAEQQIKDLDKILAERKLAQDKVDVEEKEETK